MGIAVDTVGFSATNPSTTVTAVTFASGDTGTVRNATQGSYVGLESMGRQGATAGIIQIKSPLLHDNVEGIQAWVSDTPSCRLIPRYGIQQLKAQDTLAVGLSGGTAEVECGFYQVGYDDLPGSAARMHSWGDIAGLIQYIKVNEVTATTSGTAGVWSDTAITTTENLLEANVDYAVLGYLTDVAVCAIGVRGSETNNLRVCGPGTVRGEVTAEYFVQMSNDLGKPRIPVFNSANRTAVFLSLLAVATSATVHGQLILARLSQNLST